MRETYPELRIVIAGDGPERMQLESCAGQLNVSDLVRFTGHREDIYNILAALDLFVLPSLSEGVPMVILEAMSLGTPIVATRVGGVEEILRDNHTALLVPARDPGALALACGRLIDDQTLAQQLTRSAHELVVREYSAGVMTERVAKLYRSLLP
jgi:glycosyltransferase involved in cell wall biosynthesis